MVMVGHTTVRVYARESTQPVESLAWIVNEETPVEVGVPEIVAPLKLSPVGSEPLITLHENGPVPRWVLKVLE